mmetsp:Transcript_5122/g.9177  ORF Transcript_5122/g.9177 Transcript_5122/m.9177 type:complete len:112 (-) Transcript_5122:512-847(-)
MENGALAAEQSKFKACYSSDNSCFVDDYNEAHDASSLCTHQSDRRFCCDAVINPGPPGRHKCCSPQGPQFDQAAGEKLCEPYLNIQQYLLTYIFAGMCRMVFGVYVKEQRK